MSKKKHDLLKSLKLANDVMAVLIAEDTSDSADVIEELKEEILQLRDSAIRYFCKSVNRVEVGNVFELRPLDVARIISGEKIGWSGSLLID